MEEIEKRVLSQLRSKLVKEVVVTESFMCAFCDCNVLDDQMTRLLKTETNYEQRAVKLLDMLPNRGPKAFSTLMEILDITNPWLAEKMKAALHEERNKDAKIHIHPSIAQNSSIEGYGQTRVHIDTDIKERAMKFVRTNLNHLTEVEQRGVDKWLADELQRERRRQQFRAPHNVPRNPSDFHATKETQTETSNMDLLELYEEMTIYLNGVDYKEMTLDFSFRKLQQQVKELLNRTRKLDVLFLNCLDKFDDVDKYSTPLPDLIERAIRHERNLAQANTDDKMLLQKLAEERDQARRQMDRLERELDKQLQNNSQALKTQEIQLRHRQNVNARYSLLVPHGNLQHVANGSNHPTSPGGEPVKHHASISVVSTQQPVFRASSALQQHTGNKSGNVAPTGESYGVQISYDNKNDEKPERNGTYRHEDGVHKDLGLTHDPSLRDNSRASLGNCPEYQVLDNKVYNHTQHSFTSVETQKQTNPTRRMVHANPVYRDDSDVRLADDTDSRVKIRRHASEESLKIALTKEETETTSLSKLKSDVSSNNPSRGTNQDRSNNESKIVQPRESRKDLQTKMQRMLASASPAIKPGQKVRRSESEKAVGSRGTQRANQWRCRDSATVFKGNPSLRASYDNIVATGRKNDRGVPPPDGISIVVTPAESSEAKGLEQTSKQSTNPYRQFLQSAVAQQTQLQQSSKSSNSNQLHRGSQNRSRQDQHLLQLQQQKNIPDQMSNYVHNHRWQQQQQKAGQHHNQTDHHYEQGDSDLSNYRNPYRMYSDIQHENTTTSKKDKSRTHTHKSGPSVSNSHRLSPTRSSKETRNYDSDSQIVLASRSRGTTATHDRGKTRVRFASPVAGTSTSHKKNPGRGAHKHMAAHYQMETASAAIKKIRNN